ncbi:MAG: HAD-IA family hydrolase [Cyanobacteria bacterium P01_G01_bin.54]
MTPHLPIVLFDFDGTIADTHGVFVALLNRLAPEFGYPPAPPETVAQLQGLTAQDLIRQSQISVFKIPLLLRRLKQELHQEMPRVAAIAGITTILRQLHTEQYQLGIITSNNIENVRLFLALHQLTDCFTWLDAGSTLFGKHRLLKRFLKQHQLEPERVIYVGDETRDIEAARASGLPMISVGWGFNDPELLRRYAPDQLVEQAAELIPAIAAIAQARQRQ